MIFSAEELKLRDGRHCTIRSVEPEDAPRMMTYMKTMLGETPFLLRTPDEFTLTEEEEARFLEGRKNNPRGLMLLAEADGQIISCSEVDAYDQKRRMHRADLGIAVLKEYWHQGIGSAMMERLIAFAAQCGCEQIELTVESKNRRAIGLYMKYGFVVYGTRPHGLKYPDGSYDDDYLMCKML